MNEFSCPIRQSVLGDPRAIAVCEGKESVSYYELDNRISAVVRSLGDKGVRAGMKVGIISANSTEYIVLLFALLRLGCVVVPVNFRFTESDICRIMAGISIDILVSGLSEKRFSFPGVKIFSFQDLFSGLEYSGSSKSDVSLENGKTVILTSGSTGEPKGVLLSVKNHFYNAWGANLNMKLDPGDKWYLMLPLFHVGGMAILFRTFLAGAAVTLPSGRGENISKDMDSGGITHVSMVHSQLVELLLLIEKGNAGIPAALKALLAGGGIMPDTTLKRCVDSGIPVYKTYGLSEMASQVTATEKKITKDNMLSSGRILKYRALSIGPGSEIRIRGETLFDGYIANGEFLPVNTDSDGWFNTGDLGYINESGDLFVTGRKDNMFISGGENIFPEEIEKELLSLAYIGEAVVVPVDHPKFGKRPVAFISFVSENTGLSELVSELRKRLPGFKIPDRFYRIDESKPGFLKRSRMALAERAGSGEELDQISD